MLPGNQQEHLSLSLPHKRGKLNKNYNFTFSNAFQIAKFHEICVNHSLANIELPRPPCKCRVTQSLKIQA